jgi:hypothetical protein
MTKTIKAVFDSRSGAEQAKNQLSGAGLAPAQVRLSPGGAAPRPDPAEVDRSLFAQLKDFFLPQSDAAALADRMGRNAVLLSAEVDEADADRAVRVLERCDALEVEARA